MCCESCPNYEECAVNEKLKEKCCPKCPDYDACFGREDEPDEEESGMWDE